MDKLSGENIYKFLEKIEADAENIEVIEYDTKERYCYSDALFEVNLKAKIDNEEKEFHWMIKLQQEDDESTQKLNLLYHMEEKEILVYNELIPAFEDIIQDTKANIELNFCPIYLAEYHVYDSIIIMENLTKMGFMRPENVHNGLSLEVAKEVVKEMAKFHALGYAYLKLFPNEDEFLDNNEMLVKEYIISDVESGIKGLTDNFMDDNLKNTLVLLEAIQDSQEDNWKGIYENFNNQLGVKNLIKTLYGYDKNGFNTLVHGDLWFNNLLLKYESNSDDENTTTIKTCLLDLALVHYGNPCQDLAIFMFLSMNPELRQAHAQEILQTYHESLSDYLTKLGQDPEIYSLNQLENDYKRYKFLGLYMSLWNLPFVLCKKENTVAPELISDIDLNVDEQRAKFFQIVDDKMINAFHEEPSIKNFIGGNFKELLNEGFFDV